MQNQPCCPDFNWTVKTTEGRYINPLMSSFLAERPDLLSKLSHIPVLTVCHLAEPKTDLKLAAVLWARPHTHTLDYTVIPAEKPNQCEEIYSTSCLSEWLPLRQRCPTNGSFCTSLYSGTKGQLKCVCVRWLRHSTAFFPKAFTYKSRVSDTRGAAKSNKHTKKMERGFTRRAWESFRFRKRGEEFKSTDEIKTPHKWRTYERGENELGQR